MATASASTSPNDLKRRRRLLALAIALFAGWIAYLAFLALTASHPVVLSRPQFLVADLWVVADVDGPDKPIKIVDVVYAREEAPEKGAAIEVRNLSAAKVVRGSEEKQRTTPPGPGRYVLPLTRDRGAFFVTAVPRSPGYGPPAPDFFTYPDSGETRAQLDSLPRPK
jgi:hypothetical protein